MYIIKNINKKIKMILVSIIFIFSISAIIAKQNTNDGLAQIVSQNDNIKNIKLKSGSKLYEQQNNNIIEEKDLDIEKKSNNNVQLDTEDKEPPEEIKNIKTKILEDNIIINFQKPKDKGTNYNYIVKQQDKEEKLEFYCESGIKGYSYLIDNEENNEAKSTINKLDETAIVLENINWSKDYYLHIKAIDNNNNISKNKTFKLDMPSNGIEIKYVDMISKNEISCEEKISGIINDNYNAESLEKNLKDYELIKTEGELSGKLKREKINIIYQYAKKSNIIVKFLDKLTGTEIAKEEIIEGYEGKNVKVHAINVENYEYDSGEDEIQMQSKNQTISIYYNHISEENIEKEIINKEEDNQEDNQENNQEEGKTKEVTEEEEIKEENTEKENTQKEIIKEEEKTEQIENTKTKENEIKNTNRKIRLKYIDFDTNKILYEEELNVDKDNKIKVKLKEIEGYKVVEDDQNDKQKTIIDEIIEGLYSDTDEISQDEISQEETKQYKTDKHNENNKNNKNNENNENNKNNKNVKDENPKECIKNLDAEKEEKVKEEYEIVMNCDDSDYIIYYKK